MQAQNANILDMIEAGDYQKAIKQCNTKIHKNQNINFFKTLKAYCLVRTHKTVEALELCQDVKSSRPTDAMVAKYLAQIFNDLCLYSETTAILETACAANQEDEELGSELFFAYVRESKFLK